MKLTHDNDCPWNFGHDCTCGYEGHHRRENVGPINLVPVPMADLLDALGWQGGTVADALAEVRRLRADAVHVPDWSTLRPDVVGWIPVACYRDNMGVICQWDAVGPMRPRPVLGQGVAALLPEHGEVKL